VDCLNKTLKLVGFLLFIQEELVLVSTPAKVSVTCLEQLALQLLKFGVLVVVRHVCAVADMAFQAMPAHIQRKQFQ
jgi:hypothetical protein